MHCGMTGVPGIESKPEFAKRDVADLRRVCLALEDVCGSVHLLALVGPTVLVCGHRSVMKRGVDYLPMGQT